MSSMVCLIRLLILALSFKQDHALSYIRHSRTRSLSTQLYTKSSIFSSQDSSSETKDSDGQTQSPSPSSANSTSMLLAKVVKNIQTRRETASSDVKDTQVMIPDDLVTGIGGLNGTSYDVNRLKRNLLQEVVHSYKDELTTLLQTYESTEEQIADKISTLVQSTAVRTTTDSNLLDGRWGLAYRSKYATVGDLKQSRVSSPRRRRQRALTQTALAGRRKSGKDRMFRTYYRTVQLEEEDDDVYIGDETHFVGPLVKRTERYQVCGLTRQSLVVRRQTSKWYVLNRLVKQRTLDRRRRDAEEPLQNIQVVYLDVDLCILANKEDGDNATFSVYTKDEDWIGHSSRRQARFFIQAMRSFIFGKLLRKAGNSRHEYWWSKDADELDSILHEINSKVDSSKLRVLRLGDTGDVDEAWEGKNDPFIHLSPDERQRAIKGMSMRQIEEAASKRLQASKRESWIQRLLPRRSRSFRKPKR